MEADKLQELYKICRDFLDKNHVICEEASIEDNVYENAPNFVLEIANCIGFAECDDYDDSTRNIIIYRRLIND